MERLLQFELRRVGFEQTSRVFAEPSFNAACWQRRELRAALSTMPTPKNPGQAGCSATTE
jgi:hypothetical protein